MISFKYTIVNIFGILILILLASSLILSDIQQPLTFTSLLDFLSSQNFNLSFNNFIDYSITSDWSVFNFLRDFFNLFIKAFNFLIYIVNLLFQLIQFLFSMFKFLFFR